MRAPQIILIALFSISLLWSANKHGQHKSNYNFWTDLLAAFINFILLYWGGFFK